MAAYMLVAGSIAREINTWAVTGEPCVEDQPEGLSSGQAWRASVVVMMAALLAVAPVVLALAAILNPAEVTRISGGLLGASGGFTLVAAGRVPAAAFIALVFARSPRQP